MGRRGRARSEPKLRAPDAEYRDAHDNLLVLRGALSPETRRRYAALRADGGQTVDDAWQRATEFLFERLAVRWEISGVRTQRQRELLQRYRAADADERRWVRDVLRRHVAEHFPELEAP
jgi:hypothetical protein